MENCSFELIGQFADLVLVVGFFDALQQAQDSLVGCVRGSGSRFGSRSGPLHGYIILALLVFCPSCLDRFACALATLLRRELGSSGRTALFPALPPQSDGGRIFLLRNSYGHELIIPERSRFDMRDRSRMIDLPHQSREATAGVNGAALSFSQAPIRR